MRPWKTSSLAIAYVVLAIAFAQVAPAAGKFQVLYSFTGGTDGAEPVGALVRDSSGSFYGSTRLGGDPSCRNGQGCGTIFKLEQNPDGTWKKTTIYTFQSGGDTTDGAGPNGGLIFDSHGNLYGTTIAGGGRLDYCEGFIELDGCGTVFELTPQPSGDWSESVLYRFQFDDVHGSVPMGGLLLDNAGNLLGTTSNSVLTSHSNGGGVVFELSPSPSGWTQHLLHKFCPGVNTCADGDSPYAGMIWGRDGNLYGTTAFGGYPGFPCEYYCGTVFQIKQKPNQRWKHTRLYELHGRDGQFPETALSFDGQGRLYGTTSAWGAFGYGTVFQLTPQPDGSWKQFVIYNFHTGIRNSYAGSMPTRVIFSRKGDLYGTRQGGEDGGCGGSGCGVVYKLSPGGNFGRWKSTTLHKFTGGGDGGNPAGDLAFDEHGNLYGTAQTGGKGRSGVVFIVTP